MPNAPVPAAATGLPAAHFSPSRRIFLVASPAAVFGSLRAAAREPASGALLFACRKSLAAHQAYNELCADDGDPRFNALAQIEGNSV